MLPDGFFATLVDTAPNALVVYDDHSVITYVNQQTEQLFGYGRGELLGAAVESLVRGRSTHSAANSGVLLRPHPDAPPHAGELCAVRKDGSEFSAAVNLSSIGSCTIAAIHKLPERSQDRLKTDFLSNMSHELRSPLNAIIGFAKLMYSGRVGAIAETHREYLGDILTSAEHLLHVINDVVDLSKAEAGRMEFYPEPIDVLELMQDVHSSLQSIAHSKQISFDLSIAPDCESALLVLDPEKLRQVLYNLLSNALKFTPDGGSIKLRAQLQDAEHLRLEVTDNGRGIREQDLPELWKPFRQLDPAAAKRHPGAGLGLTLTKRIVEEQGGSIGVVSRVGEGSTFFAVLPTKVT